MSTIDLFYISLSAGFLVLSGFGAYAIWELARTFRSLQSVIEEVHETTQDINNLKNTLKLGVLKTAFRWITKLSKGGD